MGPCAWPAPAQKTSPAAYVAPPASNVTLPWITHQVIGRPKAKAPARAPKPSVVPAARRKRSAFGATSTTSSQLVLPGFAHPWPSTPAGRPFSSSAFSVT